MNAKPIAEVRAMRRVYMNEFAESVHKHAWSLRVVMSNNLYITKDDETGEKEANYPLRLDSFIECIERDMRKSVAQCVHVIYDFSKGLTSSNGEYERDCGYVTGRLMRQYITLSNELDIMEDDGMGISDTEFDAPTPWSMRVAVVMNHLLANRAVVRPVLGKYYDRFVAALETGDQDIVKKVLPVVWRRCQNDNKFLGLQPKPGMKTAFEYIDMLDDFFGEEE